MFHLVLFCPYCIKVISHKLSSSKYSPPQLDSVLWWEEWPQSQEWERWCGANSRASGRPLEQETPEALQLQRTGDKAISNSGLAVSFTGRFFKRREHHFRIGGRCVVNFSKTSWNWVTTRLLLWLGRTVYVMSTGKSFPQKNWLLFWKVVSSVLKGPKIDLHYSTVPFQLQGAGFDFFSS